MSTDRNRHVGEGQQELESHLKSLLTSTFACLKTMVDGNEHLKRGFADLAENAKGVNDLASCRDLRGKYKNVLLDLDQWEMAKGKCGNNGPKEVQDYTLVDDEKLRLSLDVNSAFARGTRFLYRDEDLFHGMLLELEKKGFSFQPENVSRVAGLIKNFFYTKLNESEVVEKEKGELKTIIKSLTETMEDISSRNSNYQGGLKTYATKIVEAVEIGDIIKIKEIMRKETRKVLEESENFNTKVAQFEEELKNSAERIQILEEELLKVKEESSTDPLTKVLNRRYFDLKIQEVVNEFSRYGSDTCFVMLDIDFFKKLNDRYGHQAGDKALEATAKLIKESVRKTDLIFRYGGEEFAAILSKTNIEDGRKLVEELRLRIAEQVFAYKGEPVSVTISCGITTMQSGDTAENLVERADKALYQAKENGRNRVIVYS